jgi:hypothetical protein
MYSRAQPHIGQSVTVLFLAERIRGTVTDVDSDQRGLQVLTDEDEQLRFVLQPTTGRFQSDGQTGARLYFNDEFAWA